jgi:alpha-amylase/alpha-mannosidase (GH57 family)
LSDTRWLCIHGHFYQPPRENPWLESIEQQESAYPYHDWNERITAESYGPNAQARILDEKDRIIRIVNNYSSISYNFGPNLLQWLEDHSPDTYGLILSADRASAARFGGHGSALAQAYNHVIMPLADERDIQTQVLWGKRDFEHRFGRAPEGMWLPETAVDTRTLEALAAAGVSFTILAPHQAAAARRIGAEDWIDVSGGRIDTTQAYVCNLPSGRSITLFFYDGPVSRAVAFEGLLKSGEVFANRVLGLLRDETRPMLAHIATDGETYGHHHRHGEMALAYAMHYIQHNKLARITNYGEFLEHVPPQYEVQIEESTSWSCAHGLERWRSNCGCHTGGKPGWNQRWREPLRDALDWLRDEMRPHYEQEAGLLLRDPWAARDAYIDVVLDRVGRLDAFFAAHARTALTQTERTRALELLELQRHAMFMYTSCGWFFNDVAGIESVQVLAYAGRAIQLAEKLFGISLQAAFCEKLALAVSNEPKMGTACDLYRDQVEPLRVDLLRVGAHYAVDSAYDNAVPSSVYCYDVKLEDSVRRTSGETQLLAARARITSRVTLESEVITFAVLHLGGHNLAGGIRRFEGAQSYNEIVEQLTRSYETADLSAVVRALAANFPEYPFSLKSLFTDRQREVLYRLLQSSVRKAEAAYRRVYEENTPFTRFLVAQDLPLPRAFMLAAEFVINHDLRAEFDAEDIDVEHAQALVADAESLKVPLDKTGLAFALKRTLERLARRVRAEPDELNVLEAFARAATLACALPLSVDLWKVQNDYYELLRSTYEEKSDEARSGAADAVRWVELFKTVGAQLDVAVT